MVPPGKLLALAFCGCLNPVQRLRKPLNTNTFSQYLEILSVRYIRGKRSLQSLRQSNNNHLRAMMPASSLTDGPCAGEAAAPNTSAIVKDPLRLDTSYEVYHYLRGRWNLKKTIDYKVGGMAGTWEGVAVFSPKQQQLHADDVQGHVATAAPKSEAISNQNREPSTGGLDHGEGDESRVLRYLERGVFKINGEGRGIDAGQRLVYDCGNTEGPVRVHFVDDPNKPDVLRFFHELDFRSVPSLSVEPTKVDGACTGVSDLLGGQGLERCPRVGEEANPVSSRNLRAEFEHLCVRDMYRGDVEVLGPDEFRTR